MFHEFFAGYVAAALWTCTDDDGTPLDSRYVSGDIASDALAAMQTDCEAFHASHRELWISDMTDSQAGHDYWLTRNGHGVGYWGRGIKYGNTLTVIANAASASYLYVGDDSRLYIAG